MVSLMSALAVLVVGSFGVSSIIMMRFVISVSIPIFVILAWGIAIVWMVILVTSLIRPVFSLVSVALVTMVDTFLRLVTITTPCFVGLGFLFRLFAL